MKFLSYNERIFWKKVFVATMRGGQNYIYSKDAADYAVLQSRERSDGVLLD